MGVARGQAEEAGENRESLQPESTAGIQIRVDKEEYIGLRWAAAYWKARHGEAVQREADLKRDNGRARHFSWLSRHICRYRGSVCRLRRWYSRRRPA